MLPWQYEREVVQRQAELRRAAPLRRRKARPGLRIRRPTKK